ncbi:MAG: 4Fe-4S ferredoxin [Desulfobacterales bacterium]|nr:4Fe-4S ferredoxin [Desulfobacterales bacterium]
MEEYSEKIREISKQLLAEGRVEMIIGFARGSVPMMNEPLIAVTAEEVEKLVWDSNCGINLTNYLTGRREKIGIVAKGCDSRNIVTHIIENKIRRDQLFIIGVPCRGMIDRRKIIAMFDMEIHEVVEDKDQIVVKGAGFEKTLNKKDVLQGNCAICLHRNPVIHDALIGDRVEEQKDVDRYVDVRRIEALSPEEKGRHFENLLKPCLRCYACRNACPLCYCPTCFVDEHRPQWVGKSQDPADVATFHFLRAFHCAGRCTDCGACERACPVGIEVRQFTKKLEKDCLELFTWEAGMSLDERPPLDVYRPEDPDGFIR